MNLREKLAIRKGRPMDLINHLKATAKRQYSEQSNLVYLSAFFAFFAIIPLYVIIGDLTLLVFCLISMLASGISVVLNRKQIYELASFIFITTISIHSLILVIILGLSAGFTYYFFNMCVLIVFTRWQPIFKLIAIILEIIAFISVSIYAYNALPITEL